MEEPNTFDAETTRSLLQRIGRHWQTDLKPRLDEALRTLPDEDAQIVHLSVYQEVSDDEIAALLEMPGGRKAVAARRRAAVRRLTDGDGVQDLEGEQVEALLRLAGEAWRTAATDALSDEDRTAATRAMTRALRQRGVSTSAPAHDERARANDSGDAPTADRPARRRGRTGAWRTPLRAAALVCIVLLTLYGGLWLAGRAMLPDTHPLASVEGYEAVLRGTVRSDDGTPDSGDAFAEGAEALRAAPESTWGLFPRYDRDTVQRAIESLAHAFASANDPFERARAAFFLGKAYLMLDNPTAARWWLQRCVEQDVAAYRDDAQTLLRRLDTP